MISDSGVSVCIPVGPFKGNKDWLDECLDSVINQTLLPESIVIIDDGAKIPKNVRKDYTCKVYKPPWHIGISHAFNFGVALSPTDLVMMLGSDDTLEPTCLEQCYNAYIKRDKQDGYYSVPIRYMDDGSIQTAPCNAAMVTKDFWRMSGGFPIETSMGMGDHTLLSICIAHKLPVFQVGYDLGDENTPLYNYRRHPDIHTFKMAKFFGVQAQLEEILTNDWQKPEWGQNYG